MSSSNKVLAILKNKSGKTVGARIRYNKEVREVSTEFLRSNTMITFNNAIIDRNGYARARSGELHVEVLDRSSIEIKGITLYHGSDGGLHLPITCRHSKSVCDFGDGFYMGTMLEQAVHRIHQYPKGVIYELKLDLTNLKTYSFEEDVNGSTLWALYVAYNRGKFKGVELSKGMPKLKKIFDFIDSHDIVIGHIADDKMAASFRNFINNNTTNEVLFRALKEVRYGSQFVAKTQKACNSVSIVRSRRLTSDDKIRSKQWGQQQKSDMDTRVRLIVRDYRKKGKYLDELMEEFS